MYQVVMELQAPSFRDSSHYVELMLVGLAFFTLGRRRPLDLFHLALLTVATVVAFRTLRDAWFLCISVAGIVAYSGKVAEVATPAGMPLKGLKVRGVALAVAGAICVIALRSWDSGLNNRNLEKTVRNSYPWDAVRYVQQQRLPGPLFNNYNWGGFLIDTLPEYPVSIDSRGDLYGDDLLRREIRTLNAVDWTEDPALAKANLILLPAQLPLARALQGSPQFKIVYADNMAVIFIRSR
jgi:hypothetical protein